MAHSLQCPGCRLWLRIPDGVTEPSLSCPHCLARLPNPAAGTADGGIQTAPSSEARPLTCPTCGEAIEGQWRYCPACREDLRSPAVRRLRPGADVDVRRDQRGTGGAGIGLGILLLFGVVLFFAGGGLGLLPDSRGVLVFILLLVGLMVAGVLAIARGNKVLGGLAFGVAGALILGVLVTLLVILAAVWTLLETCSKGCK
jgi:hypothetical protein